MRTRRLLNDAFPFHAFWDSASIHYSIWRYRHLECVTRAEIKAAVEEYGSVEDIPSVKYYVRGEDRENCNDHLSWILNVSIEAKLLCW